MTTTKVKVSKRAEAYLKAHNLNPDDVFEMGISSFARDHSLGDSRGDVRTSGKSRSAHVTYSPTFITKGDTNVSILSNIKLAFRVVFAPQTGEERFVQYAFLAGMAVATAIGIGSILLL